MFAKKGAPTVPLKISRQQLLRIRKRSTERLLSPVATALSPRSDGTYTLEEGIGTGGRKHRYERKKASERAEEGINDHLYHLLFV